MVNQLTSHSSIPFDQSVASAAVDHGDVALLKILDRASEYFSLLSEPSRLRIIQSICYQEQSVQQVVETTGLPQPNVSRHLSLLHRSGVLSRRRSGTSVFYRVSDDLLTEICRLVCVRLAGKN
jgi:DNA-binding transcriptional ArsR family regulator